MRKILFISWYLLIQGIVFAQTPTFHDDLHWQWRWEDNFNTFDNTKWLRAHLCDHNKKPFLFLKENAWVINGNLVIEANNYGAYCPPQPLPVSTWSCGSCLEGWHSFTSGWVETHSAYHLKFGYIEAKIKLPYIADFFHSAFWTWQGAGAQHNQAEIDIFEMLGWLPSNIMTTNIHTCYTDNNSNCNEEFYQEHLLSNFNYTDWHIYSIEWDADRIIWYVDGKSIRAQSNHGINDSVRLIFDIGIRKDATTFPPFQEYMYVDYVKVYQLRCDKNTPVYEITNYDNPQAPNYYNYAVKKLISLSGTSSLTAGQNVFLRAAEYIELTNGFEVPLGAELYLDISPCEMVKTGRQ